MKMRQAQLEIKSKSVRSPKNHKNTEGVVLSFELRVLSCCPLETRNSKLKTVKILRGKKKVSDLYSLTFFVAME
jgi:hypothetical protein